MSTTEKSYQLEIAQTIKQQIDAAGNVPLTWAFGASNFVFLNGESIINPGEGIRGGLMFKVNLLNGQPAKGVKVIVELTGADDYNVVVGRQRGVEWKELHRHEGIYFDTLGATIAEHILDMQD